MLKGLRGKIWASIILLITFILVVSWVLQVLLLEKTYMNQKVSELTLEANELTSYLIRRDAAKVQQKLMEMSTNIKGRITIVDTDGNIAYVNTHMAFRRNPVITHEQIGRVFAGKKIVYKSVNPAVDTSTLILGVPISDGNNIIAALIFNVPIENIDETILVIQTQLLYITLGALVLSVIFAFAVSKFLSTPLVKINRVAKAMAQGDFTSRVEELSHDEIGQLGRTLNFMATSLDSTLLNLNKNNQKLNNILSSIGEGVIAVDVNGKVVHANSSIRKYLDIPKLGEVVDKGSDIYNLVLEVKQQNHPLYLEKQAEDKILAYRVTPYHTNEEVEGAVIVISDITRDKNLERLRQELVANVSHELRTPISLIQGYSEAIKDGIAKDIDKEEEFIEVIYSESERLAKLVEDILDMSAMESGGFNIEREFFDIGSLIKRIILKTSVLAKQSEIDIVSEVPSQYPLVIGDEKRIEQVLINLISNSINSTGPGGRISVRIGELGDRALIEVTDNGSGIPQEDLPYIWDRFYRADKSRDRKKGGTGLGLSIVKNILRSHGSEFGVESNPNIETRFYFTLEKEGDE